LLLRPLMQILASGGVRGKAETTTGKPVNGNALAFLKATRPNVKASPGLPLAICLLAVVAIRLSGYGKVRGFISWYIVSLTHILAQPDADFECMGVLMEHTQDVKCVAWHPTEEVNRFSRPYHYVLMPVFVA
jgi:hypothetical protein